MRWFITKLRRTATFGIVSNVLPFCSSDHGFISSASLTPVIVAHAAVTFLSKSASSASTFAGASGGDGDSPPGAGPKEAVKVLDSEGVLRKPAAMLNGWR